MSVDLTEIGDLTPLSAIVSANSFNDCYENPGLSSFLGWLGSSSIRFISSKVGGENSIIKQYHV